MSSIAKLVNVTKSYIEAGKEHKIIDNLNIDFIAGEFTVLLGKSGSGKSTLLNLISGIDDVKSGDIYVNDICLTKLSENERTLFRRNNIGIIFQFFNLIPTLNVMENVLLPLELSGKKVPKNKAGEILEKVGLGNRLKTMPDKLSGGEQQRVAIARALINEPSVILADEPTGNLDEENGKSVLNLLLELTKKSGKTLIMATHSLEILPFADKVYTIHEHQLTEVKK